MDRIDDSTHDRFPTSASLAACASTAGRARRVGRSPRHLRRTVPREQGSDRRALLPAHGEHGRSASSGPLEAGSSSTAPWRSESCGGPEPHVRRDLPARQEPRRGRARATAREPRRSRGGVSGSRALRGHELAGERHSDEPGSLAHDGREELRARRGASPLGPHEGGAAPRARTNRLRPIASSPSATTSFDCCSRAAIRCSRSTARSRSR
jgi:hypothetical protein